MRDEEIDWAVYHALLEGKASTFQDLEDLGMAPSLIRESIGRLEESCLVERAGDSVRVLSVQESLLVCQAKYDGTCPFVVENGIVRARSGQERRSG